MKVVFLSFLFFYIIIKNNSWGRELYSNIPPERYYLRSLAEKEKKKESERLVDLVEVKEEKTDESNFECEKRRAADDFEPNKEEEEEERGHHRRCFFGLTEKLQNEKKSEQNNSKSILLDDFHSSLVEQMKTEEKVQELYELFSSMIELREIIKLGIEKTQHFDENLSQQEHQQEQENSENEIRSSEPQSIEELEQNHHNNFFLIFEGEAIDDFKNYMALLIENPKDLIELHNFFCIFLRLKELLGGTPPSEQEDQMIISNTQDHHQMKNPEKKETTTILGEGVGDNITGDSTPTTHVDLMTTKMEENKNQNPDVPLHEDDDDNSILLVDNNFIFKYNNLTSSFFFYHNTFDKPLEEEEHKVLNEFKQYLYDLINNDQDLEELRQLFIVIHNFRSALSKNQEADDPKNEIKDDNEKEMNAENTIKNEAEKKTTSSINIIPTPTDNSTIAKAQQHSSTMDSKTGSGIQSFVASSYLPEEGTSLFKNAILHALEDPSDVRSLYIFFRVMEQFNEMITDAIEISFGQSIFENEFSGNDHHYSNPASNVTQTLPQTFPDYHQEKLRMEKRMMLLHKHSVDEGNSRRRILTHNIDGDGGSSRIHNKGRFNNSTVLHPPRRQDRYHCNTNFRNCSNNNVVRRRLQILPGLAYRLADAVDTFMYGQPTLFGRFLQRGPLETLFGQRFLF